LNAIMAHSVVFIINCSVEADTLQSDNERISRKMFDYVGICFEFTA
jgi:hypothetical protein